MKQITAKETKKEAKTIERKERKERNNVIERKKKIEIKGNDNWIADTKIVEKLKLQGDGKLGDDVIDMNLRRIVNDSRREDILVIDSLNVENRFRKEQFKKNITGQHSICLFAFFVRGKSQRDGHWMLIVVDKREVNKKVYCMDSFNGYFGNTRTTSIKKTIIDAFDETERDEKIVVDIIDVKITSQRTNW